MAHIITPSLIILAATFIAFSSSSIAFATEKTFSSSTISAAPSISPDYIAPSSSLSPTLSPDISPLFPSPGGSELSPSVPLIPSSPSPPNPDAMEEAPGPGAAFSPSEVLPESSSDGLNVAVFLSSMVVVFTGIWVNQDLVYTIFSM
ncbi:hypothetical protein ACS0TY_007740 [Phlomoides rotata]